MLDMTIDRPPAIDVANEDKTEDFCVRANNLFHLKEWKATPRELLKEQSLILFDEYLDLLEVADVDDISMSGATNSMIQLAVYDSDSDFDREISGMFFDKFYLRFGERIKEAEWLKGVTVDTDMAQSVWFYWEKHNEGIGDFNFRQIREMTDLFWGGYALDNLVRNQEDQLWNEKMGIMIRLFGYIKLSETLRSNWSGLVEGKYGATSDLVAKYESALRSVLPYEEMERHYREMGVLSEGEKLPIPHNLSDVYKNIDFEKYPPSLEQERRGLGEVESNLIESGLVKTDRICVLGSGTGWEVVWFKKKGWTNVVGVEIDPKNIETAVTSYPDGSFVKGSAFELADIFSKNEESFKAVIARGRTATHFDSKELREVVSQVASVLDPKGIFYLDYPDTTVQGGVYEEYLKPLKDNLKRFRFSDRELEKINFIFDGPAARDKSSFWSKWLYTRFVPDREWIEKQFRGQHLKLLKQYSEMIGNGTGDQNINFIFRLDSNTI